MTAARGQWLLECLVRLLGRRGADLHRAIDLTLEENETWSARVRASEVEIRCLSGTVWLTREGDLEDRVLSAGDTFVSRRRGRLAMMAFQPARVRVARCVQTEVSATSLVPRGASRGRTCP